MFHTCARRGVRHGAEWVVVPAGVYLTCFTVFTWPWMGHFSSRFFTDSGDGLQNVWNMWWVNHSVTVLHQQPWHTTLLHWPYGTTLLGQTMNPFNGFVGIGLQRVLTLAQAFNTMVVFSFVATGVTAFWLCHFFSRRYLPSLVGGFTCTFSAYHLSKTLGLMQLVSLEWVPLFILVWWRLLTKPTPRLAVTAALALLLVQLCDFYYFLFVVVIGAAVAVHLWRRRVLVVDRRSALVFGVVSAVLVVPLPAALAISNLHSAMQGGHPSQQFGADALSLFLDGGHWRFAFLTRWYWAAIHSAASEATAYLTATVTALLGVAVIRRHRLPTDAGFWMAVAAVAGVLSLGPRLVVHGEITHVPLPFALLQDAVPILRYNLEPDRIAMVTTLAAAVLVAMVLGLLDLRHGAPRVVFGLVCLALTVEVWPAAPPVTPVAGRPYVAALARLPVGGVIDDAAVTGGVVDKSLQLYDQVLDGQPLAFGYISRTPASVAGQDAQLAAVIADHRYRFLCVRYGFRYWTTPADQPLPGRLPVVYADAGATVYGLC